MQRPSKPIVGIKFELFETDIEKPSTVAVLETIRCITPDVGMKDTPTEGFLFITYSYTMSFNKNLTQSPAPTQNERTITRNKIIARVMRGERFRLRTDRMGFTYRFEREDDIHFTFYINNLLVGATTQGAFQDMGFALSLRVLGEPTVFTVLRDDIRFIDEPATLPFLTISRKGGAVC